MNITQFTIEEVRCFAERQTFEIRPLTFLVGENSTGKTTALACFHVLADFLKNARQDFNVAPYSMGIFSDIVRRSHKKEKAFRLGFTIVDVAGNAMTSTVEFCEQKNEYEPKIRSVSFDLSDGNVILQADDTVEGEVEVSEIGEGQNRFLLKVRPSTLNGHDPYFLMSFLAETSLAGKSDFRSSFASYYLKEQNQRGSEVLGKGFNEAFYVLSTSPVRSRPKRTYDPTREFDDPEGSDVPMRLMRIEATNSHFWKQLKRQLDAFGEKSELFQSIEVKNLGRSAGAPFQLRVKVRGPNANIMDVGYGISQILPILVHILNAPASARGMTGLQKMGYYLLQQPEVHLHPKAQAELSSLLSQLASMGKQSFIVETHSDYLVDRARIEIRRGNIKSDDVSLIYLEPNKNKVKVHNISFDEMGNMIGVPPKFRDFFLLESDRLMGFED